MPSAMSGVTLHRTDPARNMWRYYRLDIQRDLFGAWSPDVKENGIKRAIERPCRPLRRSGTEKVHKPGATMPKPKLPPTPTDDEVRALLVRYL